MSSSFISCVPVLAAVVVAQAGPAARLAPLVAAVAGLLQGLLM
jgi:hypothetical protein